MNIQIELREYANKLRTKPIPLSEIIPLLQKAADRLDETGSNLTKIELENDELKEKLAALGFYYE